MGGAVDCGISLFKNVLMVLEDILLIALSITILACFLMALLIFSVDKIGKYERS